MLLFAWLSFVCCGSTAELTPIGKNAAEADYYRLETISVPTNIVLEVGGMAFLPNGRLMICTRRGEIWSADLEKNDWQLFASGLHEPLGIHVIASNQIVVAQRPELTRISDTDGDGKADLFETLTDAFGVSGNYHEYHFGPVRDHAGNFFGTLNVGWEDTGVSWVPYRGWAYKLTPKGEFIPFALGLRSPSGIGFDPNGELFVVDNQGDWLGASPLLHVTQNSFYGHPASLKWGGNYSGPNDPRTIPIEQLAPRRKWPTAWFVYGPLGRSPTEPVWDSTHGKFGPFTGQLFVGDQTQSIVSRVALEKIGGEFQGAIFPFHSGFASGITRQVFDKDGRLVVGMTDRGWTSVGGRSFGLQRLVWSGDVPLEIYSMNLRKNGFDLHFTKPVDAVTARDPAAYSLQHYHYLYQRTYGSPQVDVTPVKVSAVKISRDRKTVSLTLPQLVPQKIYELHIRGLKADDGSALLHPEAYYTLNKLVGK